MEKKKFKEGDQITLVPEIDSLILYELDIVVGGHQIMRELLRVRGEAHRRMWEAVHKKYPELEGWECTIDQIFKRLTVVHKRDD